MFDFFVKCFNCQESPKHATKENNLDVNASVREQTTQIKVKRMDTCNSARHTQTQPIQIVDKKQAVMSDNANQNALYYHLDGDGSELINEPPPYKSCLKVIRCKPSNPMSSKQVVRDIRKNLLNDCF